ncbi:MAG: BBP7 family outer membrane beta-barrel protein [Pirellulales bacterium]|nr:BBP7 family outer membrane beta-barrel protein [Pirellulales bacterium]
MNCKAAILITIAAMAIAAGDASVGLADPPRMKRAAVRRGQPLAPTAPAVPEDTTALADEAMPPADQPPGSVQPEGMEPSEVAGEPEATETPDAPTEAVPDDEAAPEEVVTPQAAGAAPEMFEGEDFSPYQERCPNCGNIGCVCPPPVCPPTWYVEADAVWLQRNASHRRRIAQTFATIVINNIPITGTVERGNARSLNFLFEPGTRVTVGRVLFQDFLDRYHSIEATYLGWYDWGASQTIQTPAIIATPISQNAIVVSGNLFTPFPTNTAGFGRLFEMRQDYSSTFQNLEFNYRIRRSLEQDRLVASVDGTWVREITPQGIPSFLMGLRYIEIDERYNLRTLSVTETIEPNQTILNVARGNYNVRTRNHLFGFQIGGDWVEEHARFNWGGRGKFGLFGNASRLYTDITATPDAFGSVSPARNFIKDRGVFSFVGEFGLMASWHVTKHISLRAAYDWMWIANIAVAPEQLNFRIGGPNTMNTGGFRFLQGPSIGGQVVW